MGYVGFEDCLLSGGCLCWVRDHRNHRVGVVFTVRQNGWASRQELSVHVYGICQAQCSAASRAPLIGDDDCWVSEIARPSVHDFDH